MNTHRNNALLTFLRQNGPTSSARLVEHFEISRATLSRRVRSLGDAIVTIGKGRTTQLAARHENTKGPIPLYQISEKGLAEPFGNLTALQEGSTMRWFLKSDICPHLLLKGEFEKGLFPGWPWFLEDLRPSGFLGQAFSKRMARLFQMDENADRWNDLELINCLIGFGSNLQGNFLLGDQSALQEFHQETIDIADGYYRNEISKFYPLLAHRAITEGEKYGSSAGGEQQKFTTMVCDHPEQSPRAVIVKFSPKLDTASGRRWADLLRSEQIASQVLNEAGFATAKSRIFEFEERVFLESERFDRIGPLGRRGLVSLRSFDAAHLGIGKDWDRCARKMHAGNWISAEDSETMICLHCFGSLIANNDMHLGNLSFFIPKELEPFSLAPIYDMLPMFFRPANSGEIVNRTFEPTLPKPENREIWLKMYPHAVTYWKRIAQAADISQDFKTIAREVLVSIKGVYEIAAGNSR